jgi:hypothetical protein
MKRFGWIALFMTLSLYGCAVAVPPKYKIAVRKQNKTLPPNEWCSLTFTLTNTLNFPGDFWMEATVLDAENKTVDVRFVTFPSLVNFVAPVGKTGQQEVIIYTTCDRIRQVVITANGQFVEPASFAWEE